MVARPCEVLELGAVEYDGDGVGVGPAVEGRDLGLENIFRDPGLSVFLKLFNN